MQNRTKPVLAMDSVTNSELTERIVEKAKSLGAANAGVVSVESLMESPSHRIYPKIGIQDHRLGRRNPHFG